MNLQALGFDEAIAVVSSQASSVARPATEQVPLLAALGRILAAAIYADRNQPPFDRATRDGFAVRAEEFTAGSSLHIVGQVRAGEVWPGPPLQTGEAIEIMTGAPVPAGANAVVMIEHVERSGQVVRGAVGRSLRVADNIVAQGSEAFAGQVLLPVGTLIGPAEIALAAACGAATLTLFRKPLVAIVATGDELVELDQPPAPQQIRNSNSYALASLVTIAGGDALRLPIAADTLAAIQRAIEAGRRADLLVLSGGVSMGQYDLVEEVLLAMGAEFFFTGVTMQPGKPVVFGRLPATSDFTAQYFFGLPGNPISTQVTFHVFVETMIQALRGTGAEGPRFVLATLVADIPAKPGLTRLLPARLTGVEVELVGWQGSGDLAANARANCYCLLPADHGDFTAGDIVRILLR